MSFLNVIVVALSLCVHQTSAFESALHKKQKAMDTEKRQAKAAGQKSELTYADTAWAEDFERCGDAAQSPIDINFNDVTFGPKDKRQGSGLLQFMDYKALGGRMIINHGHNLHVNGEFGDLNLPDGTYEVKQFHFHFPSEHTINGQHTAGEMHIVHQRKGSSGTKDLAVVGVLLQEADVLDSTGQAMRDGKEELRLMYNLGFHNKQLPHQGKEKEVRGTVDLTAFNKEFAGPFFHYSGSLTTPPCSQTVHWYVMQNPAVVTRSMIHTFKKRFPGPTNNRPLNPLNGRSIIYSEIALPGEYETSTDALSDNNEQAAQEAAASNGDEAAIAPAPAVPMDAEAPAPAPALDVESKQFSLIKKTGMKTALDDAATAKAATKVAEENAKDAVEVAKMVVNRSKAAEALAIYAESLTAMAQKDAAHAAKVRAQAEKTERIAKRDAQEAIAVAEMAEAAAKSATEPAKYFLATQQQSTFQKIPSIEHRLEGLTKQACVEDPEPDLNKNCPAWAAKGECIKNARYMVVNCRTSCQICEKAM